MTPSTGTDRTEARASEHVWDDDVRGIWDAFTVTASRRLDHLAFVVDEEEFTFSDVVDGAMRCSASLAAAGVGIGTRVAVAMSAGPLWVPLFFALCRLGAVIVPMNTRLTVEEATRDIDAANCDVLLLAPRGRALDAAFAGGLRDRFAPGAADVPAGTGLVDVEVIDLRVDAGPRTLGEVGSDPTAASAHAERVTRDSSFVILYTSGSTGVPKGALLRQWPALRSMDWSNTATGLTADDCFFSPLPFHHAGGLFTAMLFPTTTGGTIVVQTRWNAAAALEIMSRRGCTVTIGHQPHWVEYLAAGGPFPARRALTLATPEVNRRVAAGLGVELCSLYGMTEMHLAGTISQAVDSEAVRLETVGTAYPDVDLAIVDPADDQTCGVGEVGEVRFRGWPHMDGYVNDPVETARVLSGGWYRTGDLGSLDPAGNLTLHGRLKEMIRVGGENVSPGEIEAALMRHPGVRQAVVGGAPDGRLGEVCVAAVELVQEGATAPDELIAFAREHLASYKVPRAVVLVTEWPRSGPGKIARSTVRENLLAAINSNGGEA